ncbi:MAG TPA: pyridoxal phosphate-dependent aminotransferase [Baekduia sp.]|nr:pyridoxal phosphate-dependent aminotransferase [Baekduia sp.]
MNDATNTALERLAIDGAVNLSDGHARQPLSASEREIVARLPALYTEAAAMAQSEAEQAFADAFFRLADEPRPRAIAYSYSTSCLVAIVAQSLADEGRAVILPEPGFDNIRDLLVRAGVEIITIAEDRVLELTPDDLHGRALWLTLPNNPTGWVAGRGAFRRLVAAIAEADESLLVVDFCFRLFSQELCAWSQYEELERAGIDHVTLEDTGKTFPLLDVKAGMLTGSPSRMEDLRVRNEEVLLNVSPWTLLLLRDLCVDYRERGLDAALWTPNRSRRDTLRAAIADASEAFRVVGTGDSAPFVWLELTGPDAADGASAIVERARRQGLHLLPGTHFFSRAEQGERFLRIPVARAEAELRAGGRLLRAVLSEKARR